MSKLTNRSQIYLRKIKAQYGEYIDDTDFNTPLHSNYESAYSNVLNANPQSLQVRQEEPKQKDGLSLIEAMSPAYMIGKGIQGVVKAGQNRRLQKFYEKESERDLVDRKEQARANSFYMTPYTTGRTSNPTMKKGGEIYQQGGTPMDIFTNFYQQQEQTRNNTLEMLRQGYEDKNEDLSQRWRQQKQEGWQSIKQGGTYFIDQAKKAVSMAMQGGGEIDETEDLYSDKFVSPHEIKEQVENQLKTESPGEEMKGNSNLLKWLFEEEPLQTYTVSDIYDQKYAQPDSQNNDDIPVRPLVDQFSSMGIQVGSINTGKHNPGSKHYSGRAFDIPGSKNGGKEGLYKIYNYLNSPEGKRQFPNIKVINEIEKPAGKTGDANHLHIELLD